MNVGIMKTVGAIVASTTVVGTLLTWEGDKTIADARQFIESAEIQLQAYKGNESRLLSEIQIKNEQIERISSNIVVLENDIKNNKEKIKTLEAEKLELEAEVSDLELQLESLNGQIALANKAASDLQSDLDKADISKYTPLNLDELLPPDVIYVSKEDERYDDNMIQVDYFKGSSTNSTYVYIVNKTENTMSIEATYDDGSVVKQQIAPRSSDSNGIRVQPLNQESKMIDFKVFDESERLILVIK